VSAPYKPLIVASFSGSWQPISPMELAMIAKYRKEHFHKRQNEMPISFVVVFVACTLVAIAAGSFAIKQRLCGSCVVCVENANEAMLSFKSNSRLKHALLKDENLVNRNDELFAII